jgi:AcrR family transcriptional regulator
MPADRTNPLDRPRVIEAAREALATEGPSGLSLRRLARRLGVTAPALYAYVASKQDLLQEVAEAGVGELVERIAAVGKAVTADPIAAIRDQARMYVDWADSHRDLFRATFLEEPSLATIDVTDRGSLANRARAALSAPVDRALRAGLLRPVDGVDAATTLFAAIHGVATSLVTGVIDAGSEVVSSVVDATLLGLADPGRSEESSAIDHQRVAGDPASSV